MMEIITGIDTCREVKLAGKGNVPGRETCREVKLVGR